MLQQRTGALLIDTRFGRCLQKLHIQPYEHRQAFATHVVKQFPHAPQRLYDRLIIDPACSSPSGLILA